jgi:hypothetical protein
MLDLGSKIGGLAAVFYKLFYIVGMFINENLIIGIMIKHLYFVNASKDCKLRSSLNKHTLHYSHIHISMRDYFLLPCKRKLNRSQSQFSNAKQRVEQDLDIINLIKTVRKLKAGLSAVIDNDYAVLKKSKEIYMH